LCLYFFSLCLTTFPRLPLKSWSFCLHLWSSCDYRCGPLSASTQLLDIFTTLYNWSKNIKFTLPLTKDL
jgi:hypothetical protein